MKARKPKVINQLKEEKQAFSLLVAKEISSAELYSYPLTILSFALSGPSGRLQQRQKDPF